MNFVLSRCKGIIVAMNACYNNRGEVDAYAARRLARYYADVGVQGLYVGGSTGEGVLQTPAERKITLDAVMEEVGGRLAVIAHIGAPSTRESVELAKHAKLAGVDAISAVPCIYYTLFEDAVERHWKAMMDSVSLPFILYHIPSTTGFHVTPQFLRKMIGYEQVAGVKITTMNSYELQQFKQIGGESFVVFNGPDEQYAAGRMMGADGGIGGSYGVMPQLFLELERCCAAGQWAEAQTWQFRINEIITQLLELPFYAACKEILRLQGLDCGVPRLPLGQLEDIHRFKVRQIYEQISKLVEQVV